MERNGHLRGGVTCGPVDEFSVSNAYVKLLGDARDHVREAAVTSAAGVFSVTSIDSEHGQAFQACVSDRSWRVRAAVTKVIADVGSGANKTVAQDMCQRLLSDKC